MAPTRKEHSNEFRETIVKHFLNGDSEHDIATKMLCSRNTIHSIIVKYKKTKCIGNILGRGRKRKTTIRVDKAIQRKIKVDRRNSAPTVRQEIEQELGVLISNQTVRRRLHEIGFYGRVARKKPYVNKANRLKRLKYVKMHEDKDMEFWKTVLWSDESKFNLFGSDGKVMVWRSPKEEFNPACTVLTVKHGGGNQMVFQQDNDPKHTSHVVNNWFRKKGIERLFWPPFSPDVNPIEHLWDELERRMKKHQPKNQDQLRQTLQAEWEGIGLDVTKKLVESVPSRLYECYRMKGYPTKY
ncbi:unnamed protein product [Rotaria sp. Silwood2]|nr:unnamed protein product [Rotaria sp. Silwood2]CAF2947655.1 unnamed protein product [Rotaria sp. Silwood2]CAF4334182.1 unnamed protein product [Rotaria sp. Silwood2]CAF4461847.1 unnamed protein product [Rotaria sp. Silwood2]CAF4479427.1 unnamed protein product [Rotaria sp. Silwood2]